LSVIRNDNEREAAARRLAEIEAEIRALSELPPGEEGPALPGVVAGLRRLAEDIGAELDRYERPRAGEVTLFGAEDLKGFGESLVKARISRGIDEGELAAAVGVSRGEIERHEHNGYQDAALWLLNEVAEALGEKTDIRLRLPPERSGPWSVLEEIWKGRLVALNGRGKLILQADGQGNAGDPPPPGPGQVNVELRYHPAYSGELDKNLNLFSLDDRGAEILSWKPRDTGERTLPRYDFLGEIDAPGGRVETKVSPVSVNFTLGPAGHGLMQDSAHAISAGPGVGSAPGKLRALVPNLYAETSGEAGGLRFSLQPTGEVQPDGVFPDQVGKILPGSFLELERLDGEEANLNEAVEAFGWFMSFYAGRAVHPLAWEAETSSGPSWTIQSLRKPSPLPAEFPQTCLPLNVLGPFLAQTWGNWVGFDAERRKRLQGVVTTYESILATRYPIVEIALTAMYLERFRDHVLGDSELLPVGEGFSKTKRDKVAKDLRDALVTAIRVNDKLGHDQIERLTRSLEGKSAKVLGLFRKSFKESLLELHERADLPVDADKIGEFIRQRDQVLHGSWRADGDDTYWVARYGTGVLEKLILRRFGYEGVYRDRVRRVGETMPHGNPSWEDVGEADPTGDI
jgi:hypothetical protein